MRNRINSAQENSPITIYNLNDPSLSKDCERLINSIAHGLMQHYSQYLDWPYATWEKIVHKKLLTQTNGAPSFTLVALRQAENGNEFVGTISAELGCPELNDMDHVWVNGLYIDQSFRKQGLSLLLGKAVLEQLCTLNIPSYHAWTIDPNLDKLYASLGMKEIGKPTVLGHQLIIRSGETKQILENVVQYSHDRNTANNPLSLNKPMCFFNQPIISQVANAHKEDYKRVKLI